MNRSPLVHLVSAAALTCFAGVLWAQQALEIIPLRHRTVDQVLPVLRPLLEPGATLSGSRGQLLLRASAANVAEIRQALEAIDRPSRRLQISVRLDDARESTRRELEASARVGSGGARASISAEDSRRAATERVDQRVQVIEGGRALIQTGQSRPIHVPGGTVIQDLASGIEVVPTLMGGEVNLEILQRRDTPHLQQSASSVVRARLGEWVELGGIGRSSSRDDRAIGSASRAYRDESRRIWVRVDEVAN
jgi:type II secretory pathway component GspD/PulD (secretin)